MHLQGVRKMSRNPLKLDEEELQILGDFERGEFESIQHFRAEKRSLEAAAKRTLKKDKRINIRISSRDLEKLQKRAVMEGIPYQTLIASTLHKFVTGKLKEPV
jgi:predicted DNA binding CopG/RHH family protein